MIAAYTKRPPICRKASMLTPKQDIFSKIIEIGHLTFGTWDSAPSNPEYEAYQYLVPVVFAGIVGLLAFLAFSMGSALAIDQAPLLSIPGIADDQVPLIAAATFFFAWFAIPLLIVDGVRRIRRGQFSIGIRTTLRLGYLLGSLALGLYGSHWSFATFFRDSMASGLVTMMLAGALTDYLGTKADRKLQQP